MTITEAPAETDFAAGFEALAAFLCEHPALRDRLPAPRHVSIPLKGRASDERIAELHAVAREMGTVVEWNGTVHAAAVEFGPVVLAAHHNPLAFLQVQERSEAGVPANPYEAACERYGRANQNWPKAKAEAERLLREADEEWSAALDNLRQYETAPGIPLPQYREELSA
jgi:hypothetical protein